jgi:hypothetical protein
MTIHGLETTREKISSYKKALKDLKMEKETHQFFAGILLAIVTALATLGLLNLFTGFLVYCFKDRHTHVKKQPLVSAPQDKKNIPVLPLRKTNCESCEDFLQKYPAPRK